MLLYVYIIRYLIVFSSILQVRPFVHTTSCRAGRSYSNFAATPLLRHPDINTLCNRGPGDPSTQNVGVFVYVPTPKCIRLTVYSRLTIETDTLFSYFATQPIEAEIGLSEWYTWCIHVHPSMKMHRLALIIPCLCVCQVLYVVSFQSTRPT